MKEKILSSEIFYEGRVVKSLRKDSVMLPDGMVSDREIVEHDPAVVILPFISPSEILLIKQYRHSVKEVLIECPAGVKESGETDLESAQRELMEETGFTAKRWQAVGKIYPAPGFCNEMLSLFFAMDLIEGQKKLDDDERIESFSVPIETFFNWIVLGKISDAKTVAMAFFLKNLSDGNR